MITIIDLKISNIGSISRAFARIGARARETSDPEVISSARALVLPGVGAFGDGMDGLCDKGLVEPIKKQADRGIPLLGICLGMQLLAEEGQEHGRRPGLGLISGSVARLEPSPTHPEDKVPNIGWNDVSARSGARLFRPGSDEPVYYFAHSYHLDRADDGDIAATLKLGGRSVIAAVERGNLFGVQFHPEKSQDAGLGVLSAFVDFVRSGETSSR